MDLAIKEKLVRLAMDQANESIQQGNSPFGAVLSDLDGNVIEVAHNTVYTDNDPTAHAEINLIRRVAQKLKGKDLSKYCLISNVQSCPMCFSAAVRSRIRHFIFGCAENETLVPKINVFDMKHYCEKDIVIDTGILQGDCEEQLRAARRNTL